MSSSFNGPANPNDQLFAAADEEGLSGPALPPDGVLDARETALDDSAEQEIGVAAGE